jgi:hypothetical protein
MEKSLEELFPRSDNFSKFDTPSLQTLRLFFNIHKFSTHSHFFLFPHKSPLLSKSRWPIFAALKLCSFFFAPCSSKQPPFRRYSYYNNRCVSLFVSSRRLYPVLIMPSFADVYVELKRVLKSVDAS